MNEELAVVMPAHNEAGSIEETVRSLQRELQELGIERDIIVSEDGSTDGTRRILHELEYEGLITAATGENRQGYAGALKKGVEHVNHDYILFVDGDGQYFPSDFSDLWEKRDEADVIIGRRTDRADSFGRRLVSDTFQFVVRRTVDTPAVTDMTSSFRLMSAEVAREVIPELKYMRDSAWTEFGLMAYRKGFEQIEVPVRHRERIGKGDTRIYHVSNLPRIVLRQLKGLYRLRKDIR